VRLAAAVVTIGRSQLTAVVLASCGCGRPSAAACSWLFVKRLSVTQVPPSIITHTQTHTHTHTRTHAHTHTHTHTQAKAGCKGLRQQLRALNRDLSSAGDAASFDPLSNALSTQRDALLEDAATIGGALLKLAPMLARARNVLADREMPGGWLGGVPGGWVGGGGIQIGIREETPAAEQSALI